MVYLTNFIPSPTGEGWVGLLFIAYLLDLIFGDPSSLPHPIVYMGKWISMGEHRLNNGSQRKLKGAVFAVGSICLLFSMLWIFFHYIPREVNIIVSIILIFFCLAGHTLRKEVRMVFEALDRGLDDGRRQVARIVGRDTQNLSHQEVATAALETLAENLSDGVIAPIFWYCLLGVPGIMTYKLINTFDSMIGYKTERYKDFGCWAAHIDDIANYIPARLTALLMLLANVIMHPRLLFTSLHFPILRSTIKYAPQHASPNSGWPEAALASILDCRFGGPHDYFGQLFYKPYIGANPRQITTSDMHRSIRICFLAEIICVIIATIIPILSVL